MGGVSSGLTDGLHRATCCVQRRPPVRCFNPHLNLQLLKLEHNGAMIEEVWLVRDEKAETASPRLSREEHRLAIVYNISQESNGEESMLRPLRLDWQPDGLAFMHLGGHEELALASEARWLVKELYQHESALGANIPRSAHRPSERLGEDAGHHHPC